MENNNNILKYKDPTREIMDYVEGVKARQDLYDKIDSNSDNLPKRLLTRDIDGGLVKYFKDLKVIDDKTSREVPVFLSTLQQWSELQKTWEFTIDGPDETQKTTVQMPFIIINKEQNTKFTENPQNYNIPFNRKYEYRKILTFDGQKRSVITYKVPYPIPVDMSYQVRLFTDSTLLLNKYNETINKMFSSRQSYMVVNGYYIPLHLEGVEDESDLSSIENKRFYVQTYDVKIYAYLIDDKEFEQVQGITKVSVDFEIGNATDTISSLTKEGRKLLRQAIRRGGFTPSPIDCVVYAGEIKPCNGDDDIIIRGVSFSGLNETIQELLEYTGTTKDFIATYQIGSWTNLGDVQYVDVLHNLNKQGKLIVTIYESGTNIILDYELDFVNENLLRVYTLTFPNGARAFDIVVEYRQD